MLRKTLFGGAWCKRNTGKEGITGLVESRLGWRDVGFGKVFGET